MPKKSPTEFIYKTVSEHFPELYCARKKNLRSLAFLMKSGSISIFSPVKGVNDGLLESLDCLGHVKYIIAPNHYHHAGLIEYKEHFPDALLYAPIDAIPRLEKMTGLTFNSLDKLENDMLNSMSFLVPEGLKTGEVWLRCKSKNKVVWGVVDAFCGPNEIDDNMHKHSAQLLKTFPRYGLSDLSIFKPWFEKQVVEDKPCLLAPCHGALVESGELVSQLKRIVVYDLGSGKT